MCLLEKCVSIGESKCKKWHENYKIEEAVKQGYLAGSQTILNTTNALFTKHKKTFVWTISL